MEKFYTQTEQYLLGELTGDELEAFEKALQEDPLLAQSVAQHREMMQRLDALRLRKKVQSALTNPIDKPTRGYTTRIFATIAALLILLAVAFWFFLRPGPTTEFEQKKSLETTPIDTAKTVTPNETSSPPAQKPIEKSSNTAQLIALARAFQEKPSQTMVRDAAQAESGTTPKTKAQAAADAYDQQKFSLAAAILKDDQLVQADEEARFIRANARFSIDQFAGAAQDFEALKNSFQFRYEAQWNYLLCQIALGNTEKAQQLLAAILKEQDFPFRERALKLKGKF